MRFCKFNMPKIDTVFIVENESGEEYKINYISQRTALSGGWKAFSDANQLYEGDVLVFHLVEPTRFKVTLRSLCSICTCYNFRVNLDFISICFSTSFWKKNY